MIAQRSRRNKNNSITTYSYLVINLQFFENLVFDKPSLFILFYLHRLENHQPEELVPEVVFEVSISFWMYSLIASTFCSDGDHNDFACVKLSREIFWSHDNHTIPSYLQNSLYFAISLLSNDFCTDMIIWLIALIRSRKVDNVSTSCSIHKHDHPLPL